MSRILLTINGEHDCYIELDESGTPQIRETHKPLVLRDDQITVEIGGEHGTRKLPIVLSVREVP